LTERDAALPPQVAAAVAALRERAISVTDKGFGAQAAGRPLTAARLAADRPSLFGPGFTLPLLILREQALQANIAAMAAYCAAAGVWLAPHGKTTMAPQLIARQLAAGAWGVSAATIAQVQVLRAFGVPRVLLASELTDSAGTGWLAHELAADPGFECYVYVDSLAGVRLLAEGWAAAARPLPVLVELGRPGGRTGCRSLDEAVVVARAAAASGQLRLAGAAGFEGTFGGDGGPAALAEVGRFCRDLRRLGDLLPRDGAAGGYLLSAGGSAYFDIVVRELTAASPGRVAPTVVLRSGAYITHDHGFYAVRIPGGRPGTAERGAATHGAGEAEQAAGGWPALRPAIELWAPVLSRPEPHRAIIGAGRRDVSFDQGWPVPLWIRRPDGSRLAATGHQVTGLDDQHGYLRLPGHSPADAGDLVGLGISHPCTALDKWRVIPVVDDQYRVTDAIHTFF
jgi:D-serine deaminase-like pyridoxal phosphate-dependent protein